MRIQAYRTLHAEDVPPLLFAELDTLNDHFLAAFENYPDSEQVVVAAWATTGEITGEPIGALVVTLGHIITSYIANLPSDDPEFDDEFGPPLEHDEPSARRVPRPRFCLNSFSAVRCRVRPPDHTYTSTRLSSSARRSQ